MIKNQRTGSPIIPRNKADPTQSGKPVRKMYRDIENRYHGLKKALRQLFDLSFTGRERNQNSLYSYILAKNAQNEPDSLIRVNAGVYSYDLTERPDEYARFLERLQSILDEYLLDGGNENLWAFSHVAAEYDRGTLNAYTNLSLQSEVYASQTTLTYLMSQPAYQNQLAAAFISTFSDWKGISDAARADLSNIIGMSIARGVNPRETARIVSQRLDVSMSNAKRIAQTEQVGALRRANWNETTWASERLGLRTGLLWLSALKPTTRSWHAARHGKVFTVEEVEAFYADGGNRFNCYCATQPVLLNDDGTIYNKGIIDRLAAERKAWSTDKDS
ncbi:phage minor head protein [Morganella morganii]|uniref:phage minor head protein n=1 Tax=Morganella morganii TaxID=582 RepID=UPI000C79F014|nr:phage minor head protein [Morganella morganii]MDI9764537.1 phage minor head protein [Morganella morganii]PLA34414.1 phage head morphogenesis protein [Morganella morganii]HEO9697411.1 phage head morphogenesis protein [Morganella morganii subsp. morganii]